MRAAAARLMAAAKTYAVPMLHRDTRTAPAKGPRNSPIRKVPPSVDIARARIRIGTASVRKACRARLKTAPANPVTVIAKASSSTDWAR